MAHTTTEPMIVEAAPRSRDKASIRLLNDLIEACKDGEKGFRIAASDIRDPGLRRLFLGYAEQRAHFAGELQRVVHGLGVLPGNTGSLRGALRRALVDVRSALEGTSEERTLLACEREEEATLTAYDEALRTSRATSAAAEAVPRIEAQRAGILNAHDEIRRIRVECSDRFRTGNPNQMGRSS